MLIYNVTSKVNWSIHEEWLLWMKQEHIPEVLNTGFFFKSQVLRLLEVDEDDGPTYAVQYFASSTEDYHKYLEQHAPDLRSKAITRWGNQLISFRSLMEVIN